MGFSPAEGKASLFSFIYIILLDLQKQQVHYPPPGPKSEPSKNTTTSENTTRQNPKRPAARLKKNIPTAATTTPPPLPPAQTQSTLPSQQVGDGIVNNAPNNGTQVVQDNRQYGLLPPPPDVDFQQSQ